MRHLISGFRVDEHQSGGVSLLKVSSSTKSVVFYPVEIRLEVIGTNWLSAGTGYFSS